MKSRGLELCKLEIPTEFIKSGVILKDAASRGASQRSPLRGTGRGPHSRHAGTRSDQPDGRPHSGQRRVSADRYARRAGWPRRVFFHAARQGNSSPDTEATVCPLRYPIPLVHTRATAFCIRCCIRRRSNIPACAAAFSMCPMPRSSFPANRSAPSPCPCPISLAP